MLSITALPRRFITAKARTKLLAAAATTTLHVPLSVRHHSTAELNKRFQEAAKKRVHAHAQEKTAETPMSIAYTGLYPEPMWYTTTSRTPYNDPAFPGLIDGALHSIAMPNLDTCTRQEVLDYFDNTWALTDMLFSSFQHEDAFIQPPPHQLRHPMAFYYGHPTCFYINKCLLAGLLDSPLNPEYEDLFQVGVDDMRWDDMSKNEKEWPSVGDVQAYRREVYEIIKRLILTHAEFDDGHAPITAESQTWAIFMGMEHDRIHLETSSMLMQEHNLDNFVKPDLFPPYHPSAHRSSPALIPVEGVDFPTNPMISMPGGTVTLGKPADFPSYGWDNEYGSKTIEVGPFRASSQLISNGEFWQFVKDSGYLTQRYWSTTGWAWRAFRNTKWPQFWRPDGPQGSHRYKLRAIFDELPMQWDWPVQVNLHEAQAYCRWKNEKDGNAKTEYYHVTTEPMHHLLREPRDRADHPVPSEEAILALPSGATMTTSAGRNTNLSHASFSPVDAMPANSLGFRDVFGNAWQWCEDNMSALPGFQVHPIYDDFTVPCFDGEHNIIMGGSFMSSGDNGGSKYARYHFRPHFFQHAGFRLVASPVENDRVEIMTSCLNAPPPHTVVKPFRTTPDVFLNQPLGSVFLEKLEQQASTQWRDFSAGFDSIVISPSSSSTEIAEAAARGALVVVEEGVEVDAAALGLTLVKEGVLPKIEKEGADVRRVSMVKVLAWRKEA
ncbi:hypothetical protein AC1031_010807 [Aphanomyces cochlioides]|nr:hypothetical protein AC1031_010807 [Aphanomyces cochlioides]